MRIVAKDGNVMPLASNYSYSEISKELAFLLKENYLEEINGKILITDKGDKYAKELERVGKQLHKFIEPQIQYRIDPMSIEEIYIPNVEVIKDLI